MKKLKYFSGLFIIFSTLIMTSIWFDSKRTLATAKTSLQEVDHEIITQEQHYIVGLKALKGTNSIQPEQMQSYLSADSSSHRRAAFLSIMASLGHAQDDASNPLSRRFMDEMNGALNRISRLEETYTSRKKDYLKVCQSWQGRLFHCDADSI